MIAIRLAKLAVLLAVLVAAGCETASEPAQTAASAPPPPAAAPVAPMAPPPPPAPAETKEPRTFLVFFELNKWSLSPTTNKAIHDGVEAYRALAPERVIITGHTDLSGSARYNKTLSLRRARAVAAALRKEGVSADKITVIGLGESQPAFLTPDGVPEPQNRRVEIKLR